MSLGEQNEIMNVASKDGLVGDCRVEWREVSSRPGKRWSNLLDVR